MATALITGASQGIGAAIAQRLAKDGFNIAVNCFPSENDMKNAQDVAEKCRAFGVEAECFQADVSEYSQCETMVKAVKERFGSVDVLVNNAGITRDGLLARMSEENYDAVIKVNQKSVFNMINRIQPRNINCYDIIAYESVIILSMFLQVTFRSFNNLFLFY